MRTKKSYSISRSLAAVALLPAMVLAVVLVMAAPSAANDTNTTRNTQGTAVAAEHNGASRSDGSNNAPSVPFPSQTRVADAGQDTSNLTRLDRPAAADEFTIVMLPDTQWYTATGWFFVSRKATTIDRPRMSTDGPETFEAQTRWIVKNKKRWNIAYVAHVGDIVETEGGLQTEANETDPNDPGELQKLTNEWVIASRAMAILEDPRTTGLKNGIPFGLAIGNHDMAKKPWDTTNFNKHFGVKRFAGRHYFVEAYPPDTNDNSLHQFQASGMDFVVIFLRYAPTPDALNWAKKKIQDHPNRGAIVVSHALMTGKGQLVGDGALIYNTLKEQPNLFLMLCGHAEAETHRTFERPGMQAVHVVLADYGKRTHDTGEGLAYQGGNGWMQLLKFSPAKNQIQVYSFSPTMNDGRFDLNSPHGQFETDADSEFTLSYKMGGSKATASKPAS